MTPLAVTHTIIQTVRLPGYEHLGSFPRSVCDVDSRHVTYNLHCHCSAFFELSFLTTTSLHLKIHPPPLHVISQRSYLLHLRPHTPPLHLVHFRPWFRQGAPPTCYRLFCPPSKRRWTSVSVFTSTFSTPLSLVPSPDGSYFNEMIYWGRAILPTQYLPIDQSTPHSPTQGQDQDVGACPSTYASTSILQETYKSPPEGDCAAHCSAAVDGTLFILVGPPRDCRNIVVQILISVEVRLFQ